MKNNNEKHWIQTFCIYDHRNDSASIVFQGVDSIILLINDWDRAADPMFVRNILLRYRRRDTNVRHWTKPRDH